MEIHTNITENHESISKTIVYSGQKTQCSEGRIQQGSSQYIVLMGGSRQFRQGGRGPEVFVSFVIIVFHKEPYEPPEYF